MLRAPGLAPGAFRERQGACANAGTIMLQFQRALGPFFPLCRNTVSTMINLAFTTLACPTWSVAASPEARRRRGYATLLRAWLREAGPR